MQAKFNELAVIAESEASRAVAASRGNDPSSTPYRILMVGDSTMKHQFGAACGFLAERHGKRFDPKVCEDRVQVIGQKQPRPTYRLVYYCCKIIHRAPGHLSRESPAIPSSAGDYFPTSNICILPPVGHRQGSATITGGIHISTDSFYQISQAGSAGGCCVDTAGEERGGGRGLCFEYQSYRFLNPSYAGRHEVDAFYFGCGLHLLHITPLRPLEALRTQE